MDTKLGQSLEEIANTVRGLSMDGVQKANSGHPGLPMGCAEIGAYLWGIHMHYNPKNPSWAARDRFVLSAGHGSIWLYSLLHLSGYNLSMDEIKNFRQLHSKTPGHPEYGYTEGVETTTGPLGQGVANAVGMALGFKLMQARFDTAEHKLFQNKVFCLTGDGCIMEGISSEVSSFAGHVNLDNLIIIYDANDISLDGPLPESCSEDTAMRYRSYGFDVHDLDGYDFQAMESLFSSLRIGQTKPVLIRMKTIIGKGSPNKQATHKAHGSPLGPEEIALVKKNLGMSSEDFFVPQSVSDFFANRMTECQALEDKWNEEFAEWKEKNPELFAQYEAMQNRSTPENFEEMLFGIEMKDSVATRSASNVVLNAIGSKLPWLVGGSADLSGSDKTMMTELGIVKPGDFTGRNIKYGVREFGMAAICNGLALTGFITPFCGTFLTFSDYMRNAVRLAALSKIHCVYQFTHDSIFLGEDGPTHQPVEHFMALRAIPNLHVIRPADPYEVEMAWLAAIQYEGPTAIILSRQNLPKLSQTKIAYSEGMGRGAYIIQKESSSAAYTLIATGSEVSLALEVASALEQKGKPTRVVSMPCWKLFERQDQSYKDSVLGNQPGKKVSIEAGIEMGWYKYIGSDGIAIAINRFGESAPAEDLAQEFGFTVDQIVAKLT